jgi:CRISPR-associated protein Csx10
MPVIVYQLKLDEPAIFSALEGEPNSAVSYDFIPGSAVRGMLIGKFMGRNGGRLDAAKDNHRRLFFSGETRYLNAYPAFGSERSLPVPATWKIPKYLTEKEEEFKRTKGAICEIDKDCERLIITDTAIKDETEEAQNENEEDAKKRKPAAVRGFTILDGSTAKIYEVKRVINVHTQRARTSPDQQQVYRYDAIAPQQVFIGAIYCDNPVDADELYKLLTSQGQINMGGARSAGYGLMRLETAEILDDKGWQEVTHNLSGDTLTLTFISDAILKNEYGEHGTTPDAIKTILTNKGIQCDVKAIALKHGLAGGFNRKWGLPLPQIPVIERGSVIQLTNLVSEPNFEQLIRAGLGEQSIDGFGRIAINWQQKQTLTHIKYEQTQEVGKQSLSEESKDIWAGIRQRINQRTVDERMVGVVFSDHYVIHGRISLNQLSRLRAVISDELREESPSRKVLQEFLRDIEGKVAGKQYEDARIGSKSLAKWLKQAIFPELGPDLQERDRFVLQLVDAVLERAHKEKSGES